MLQVTTEDSWPVVGLGLHSRLQIVLYVSPALFHGSGAESRGVRPGLSVLTSLLVSVDVKLY